MSSMSYCMFHNTSLDLRDAINAFEELVESEGVDEDGYPLSSNEAQALIDLFVQAQEWINSYDVDDIEQVATRVISYFWHLGQ